MVAKGLRASTTPVTEVMTANPTMVRMDDKALDCLGIMIERHFRHLPVRYFRPDHDAMYAIHAVVRLILGDVCCPDKYLISQGTNGVLNTLPTNSSFSTDGGRHIDPHPEIC